MFNDIMDVWLFEYDGEFEHKMFVETLKYFFTEVDK